MRCGCKRRLSSLANSSTAVMAPTMVTARQQAPQHLCIKYLCCIGSNSNSCKPGHISDSLMAPTDVRSTRWPSALAYASTPEMARTELFLSDMRRAAALSAACHMTGPILQARGVPGSAAVSAWQPLSLRPLNQ